MTTRPESSTSLPINLIGLAGFLLAFYVLALFQPEWPLALKAAVILLSAALPIIVLEFFYRRSPIWQSLFAKKKRRGNTSRVAIKLLGLYAVFLAIAFVYWLFPEYQGDFYDPFWNLLRPVLPWLIILAIPYFYIIDQHMEKPEDAYYVFGRWLLGKRTLNKDEKNQILQLFLGWLVKLFFLPLMAVYFSNNVTSLVSGQYSWASVTQDFQHIFDFLWVLLFTIDLGFVCMGYALTFRLFDSHIRSTEPTFLGWVSALICYQPFWSGVSAFYFAYNMDNYSWGAWLADSPVLYVIWGSIILFCLTIYSLSSVMFGIRFSNLTHRGILTNGPYRYSKHPAYLSKNISWWFIAIPFINQANNLSELIRSCLLLLCLNGIYYLRAKTEEWHLSRDPVYQDYSAWMKENGIVAKLKKYFHKLIPSNQ